MGSWEGGGGWKHVTLGRVYFPIELTYLKGLLVLLHAYVTLENVVASDAAAIFE